jgi:hypothetical protein
VKIMTKYDNWGRMGNRMFPYAFGKILSIIKKAEYYCNPISSFPNTFNEIQLPPSLSMNDPIYLRKEYGSNHVNIDELIRTDRDIIIDSFLQKSIYYIPHKEVIKQWFAFDTTHFIKPSNDELVIHIRETDYKIIHVYINDDIYIKMINDLQFEHKTIVTDNCNAPLINKLREDGCKILSQKPIDTFDINNGDTIMQDYVYMLYSKYLLISQSTFSWWPAFLGDQEKVFVPITDNGMWKKSPAQDDIDLFINDKFTKIGV